MAEAEAERTRTATLAAYEVMGSAAEPAFDRLTGIAAQVLNAPIAMLTFIDDSRQWIKSSIGTDIGELPRSQTFCTHTIERTEPLVVLDTVGDRRFSGNPLVTGSHAVRFYAGVALLTPEGARIGAICVMDTVPRPAPAHRELALLSDLAKLAVDLLVGRRQILAKEHAARQAAMISAMLADIAAAEGRKAALDGVMRAFGTSCGATCGELWQRPLLDARVQRVAIYDSCAASGATTLQPALPEFAQVDGVVAAALHQDRSSSVTVAAPGRFACDPLIGAARERGLHHLLVLPIGGAEETDVIVLGFEHDRADLAALVQWGSTVADAVKRRLARKADEERLRLLGSALDLAGDGVIITTGHPAGENPYRVVYVNDSFCRTTGFSAAEMVGQWPTMLQGAETSQATLQQLRSSLRAGTATSVVLLNYRKDGTPFCVEMRVTPIADPSGTVTHFVGLQRDITSKLLEADKQRELDTSFHMLFEGNPLPMFVHEPQTLRFLMVNQAAVTFYGWSREEFMTMSLPDIKPAGIPPDHLCLSGTVSMADHRVWTHKRADGSIVHVGGVAQRHPIGSQQGVLCVVWDVTEIQTARETLDRNYEYQSKLAEQLRVRTEELTEANHLAQLGTWWLSSDRSVMTWSDELYTVIGRKRSDFPSSFANSIEVIHPDDRKLFERSTAVSGSPFASRHVDARIVRPDGRLRHVRIEFRPASLAEERGALFGYVQDISERWETQQALMRSERLAILGHLTGGIAHDFNNLLTVVTLNLEEVIAELPEADGLQGILVPALDAARRGAELTSQLLSYARQAPLRPQAISLVALFKGFAPIIRRALGPRYELSIAIENEHCTPLVEFLASETAILNIALNARDAMPAGGAVLIKASTVTLPSVIHPFQEMAAGRYALISISDRGGGIPAENLPHIFEPFYTTKPQGVGSGLGLSMVDGFVGQSGGRTLVQSELGVGTTIQLFLPLSAEPPASRRQSEGGVSLRRALLVEDQAAVLATVSRMFTQLGYDVCAVQSAAAALAELDRGADFAVMFTDIVLPGEMDGIELAKAVAQRAPDIRILLTSGFSEYNLVQTDLPGATILMKPYKRQDLRDRLNGVMAGQQG